MTTKRSPIAPADQLRVLTSGASHFFGFHDLTPWNEHTDEMVCLRTGTREDHVPLHNDVAEVVIVEEAGGAPTPVGSTRAWNWQKGARQRWLPALGRRVIAFNAESPTGFECRILDLDSGEQRALNSALYDVCDRAGFGLSLNFSRLFQCQPGYGYDHPALDPLAEVDYARDGILRVDLSTGESSVILSIQEVLDRVGMDPSAGAHYFTHIQASPDGKRYLFMHRCFLKSGGLVNHLIVADSAGSGFRVLLDDKMSHFDWSDNDHVFVWCRQNSAIKKLKESKLLAVAKVLYRLSRKIRVKAVRQGLYNESFRKIDVNTGASAAVGKGVLTEDGHPQLNPAHAGLWVNDTYPDPDLAQTLMLYHEPSNRRVDLLTMRTQPSLKETCWRCDFHPRWDPGGTRVCIDSAHKGNRQLCVVDAHQAIREILA
ncbi:MAG: hypothetical protein KDA37_10240 [Planctomycetales bacterium]|nr:hypothetical protein [Planctomycetales bacterium]